MKPINMAIVLFVYLIIGAGIYSNSLSNPFVYDDEVYVEGNRNIRSLSNIPLFFTNPHTIAANPSEAGHYRPMVITAYSINYAIGGLKPFGYHVFNIVFHIGSAFMVFLIVKAMLNTTPTLTLPRQGGGKIVGTLPSHGGGDKGAVVWFTAPYLAPLAAGILFLVHPFNSEAVNYITARSSLMSGFFYLLAFWCWIKFREHSAESIGQIATDTQPFTIHHSPFTIHHYYIASLLSFIAGILSKEVVITLPIMLWLYDIYFIKNHPHFLKRRSYIPYIPFILVVTVPYLLVRLSSFGGILPSSQRPVMTQFFTGITVVSKYLEMLFLPLRLTLIHDMDIYNSLFSIPILVSVLLLLILITAGLFLYKASSQPLRIVSFFIMWFFLVLIPISAVSLNAIFQENRGYIAVVSFCVIAGVLFGRLGETRMRKAAIPLLVLLVIIYSAVVVKRNVVWGSAVTLWEDTVQKAPGSPMSYTSLGVAYRRSGMNDRAIGMFQKAILLGGDRNFIAHDSLGRIYKAEGRWDTAVEEFGKAIDIFPSSSSTYTELGTVYAVMGKPILAEEQFIKAIRIDGADPRPHFNLGALYAKMGRAEETIKAYKMGLDLSPDNMYLGTRLKIGVLLEKIGKKEDAGKYYRQVLKNSGENDKTLIDEARIRLAGLEKQE